MEELGIDTAGQKKNKIERSVEFNMKLQLVDPDTLLLHFHYTAFLGDFWRTRLQKLSGGMAPIWVLTGAMIEQDKASIVYEPGSSIVRLFRGLSMRLSPSTVFYVAISRYQDEGWALQDTQC